MTSFYKAQLVHRACPEEERPILISQRLGISNTYLTVLNKRETYGILKFRTSNHKFPIEVLRYSGVPENERKCPYCLNLNNLSVKLGDEYHFLLECPKFENERKKYIPKKYYARPNMYKYQTLITSNKIKDLKNLGAFMAILIKEVGKATERTDAN